MTRFCFRQKTLNSSPFPDICPIIWQYIVNWRPLLSLPNWALKSTISSTISLLFTLRYTPIKTVVELVLLSSFADHGWSITLYNTEFSYTSQKSIRYYSISEPSIPKVHKKSSFMTASHTRKDVFQPFRGTSKMEQSVDAKWPLKLSFVGHLYS